MKNMMKKETPMATLPQLRTRANRQQAPPKAAPEATPLTQDVHQPKMLIK
jgi:hypothetical protein